MAEFPSLLPGFVLMVPQESTELWVAHLSPPRACWVSPSLISGIVSSPVRQENIQEVPLTCGM